MMNSAETKTSVSKRVGLALGGGAARGLAHLGVLTILEREKIPIDCVAGTSVGSLIGAAFCAGLRSKVLKKIAYQTGWRNIASLTWPTQGFVSFEKLERWLVALLGDLDFSELDIPLTVVATDIETGEGVFLKEGRLAAAVRASCSLPGIVVPVKMNGRLLVDGVVSDNLPVGAVRAMGADFVIGIDICGPTQRQRWSPLRTGYAALENLARRSGGGLETADCLISPDLAGFGYARFSRREEMIARGERAAEENLVNIRAALMSDDQPFST
jgi:NTE family protein